MPLHIMVYVLTTKLEGKLGFGPVAVTTEQHTADEWYRANPENNDWVPLEMNDLSGTGLAAKSNTTFKPVPVQRRVEQQNESVTRTKNNLSEANKLLEQALKKRVKIHARRKGRQARATQTYDEFVRGVLNGYLTHRAENEADPDPYIWDFVEYLKTQYKPRMEEAAYNRLMDAAHRLYQKTFGPK
jgi:hypothetical protein